MKNINLKKMALALFAATITSTTVATTASAAIQGSPRAVVIKLNSEGFKKCRALGGDGYKALAVGYLVDGTNIGIGDYEGNQRFRVRNCFEAVSDCKKFVNRIENIVPGIDYVQIRSCKPR